MDDTPVLEAAPSVADMERINRLFGGFRILQNEVGALIGRSEGAHLLDVAAAGTGAARWLERRLPPSRVTSVDLRHDLLTLGAGQRIAANALQLPFRDKSFDVAFSTLFLHHLSDDALRLAIAEMWRVSRKGVVAVDLARHPLAYRFLAASKPVFRWNWITLVDGPRSVQAAYTAAELRGILTQAGYSQCIVRNRHPWFRLSVRIPR